MTNVPNELRDMWTDVYKLFDVHYLMENTPEAWELFTERAKAVWEKHGRNKRLMSMICTVIDMIDDRIKTETATMPKGV